MNERDFDDNNESETSDAVVEQKRQAATPWRRAMDRTITGMALSVITLSFLALDYLLPTIGIILLLLGFGTLRSVNGWFKSGWVLTLLRAVFFFFTLILNATIYQRAVYDSAIGSALNMVNLGVQFLMIFCLWGGIKAVRKKADASHHNGSAGALLVWYILFILLAWVRYHGIVIGLGMIAGYILIIRSLYRLSEELEEPDDAVKKSRVTLSDRHLVRALVAVLAVGIICGYAFFGRYRMNWQAEETAQSTTVTEVKADLLALGYPPAALEDLSHEDLMACQEALRVVAQTHEEPVNQGHEVREVEGNATYITTAYDVKELRLTNVAVELPGEIPRWKIFHHFRWTVNPGFAGTEALQIWPAYRNNEGWAAAGEMTGRVLYDANGTVYTAPFHSLAAESYTSDGFFWGEQDVTDIFATFSMPGKGEGQRGYVAYGIEEVKEGWMVNAWVNYTHQKSRFQYPVLTAEEKRKASGWNDAHPFITVQNALQFFITDEGVDMLSESHR
ncbi:hypothetical protein [Anoxynatronum buryatiense]|uniref:Uncharacterized protein n=1 Tax=Anoxynatronum buryatiense TaxID=489973 RepID=A0AA45WVN5_9CLOT|nr:hypothetical protein [Anoxynatronum buryatiense]SMP54748.1 hypothetical protein SAMN06296020_105157 [Anoxynatronum buryatiense]